MKASSDRKPIAMVLGGTSPHVELVRNLQRRGYHTILIDYLENPPAKAVADEHVRESTLDGEKVLAIAKSRQAALVISVCIDQANLTACYVAEKLSLPAPYNYQTAMNVTHKAMMKRIMVDHGVPTSNYQKINGLGEFDNQKLKFPVIVKPVDSNSSKGVRKASNELELKQFLNDALAISRSSGAIVEEFVEGLEIGIDCFVQNGEATILMTKERRKISLPSEQAQQIYGCIWPAEYAKKNHQRLKEIADQIARAFGLNNSPLMIQAIVGPTGINVIEFGARFGGGESYKIIKLISGLDVVDLAVDSFLGRKVTLERKEPEIYYADNFIYAKAGRFGCIKVREGVLPEDTIDYLYEYKKSGVEIGSEITSNNRVGVFAVKSSTRVGLLKKINAVVDALDVHDTNGNSIMRKDIYVQSA